MELSKLQHGRILTCEVRPLTEVGIEKVPRPQTELTLTTVSDQCALRLPGQQDPIYVEGFDRVTQQKLSRLAAQVSPRLCWLAAVRAENNQLRTLTIQIHEFSERVYEPQLKIGVDEKLVADIERQLAHRSSVGKACTWLADQLLIAPAADGQKTRALLIGLSGNQAQPQNGFRILGTRYALDVHRESEGGCQALRLTRPRTPLTPEDYRPIILVEGDIEFTDRTVAGQMRQGISTELDQIVRTAGSYLGVWNEYQGVEERRMIESAKHFGWLRYSSSRRSPTGYWTFQLDLENEWAPTQLRLRAIAGKDLEVSADIPEVLTRSPQNQPASQDSKVLPRRDSRRAFRGAYIGGNPQSIMLQPDSLEAEVLPPEKGYIYVSLRGDQKRIQRRREAHTRIVTGQAAMPQLRLLLENRSVPVHRVQAVEPLSAAAKAKFRGSSPTSRQVEAIRIALNTPDIAVIQGPPGTGKTRTISAIIERLSEIAQADKTLFPRVLLTSFQHDAVENAAAMTEIFGLPTMKVGRRRGHQSDNLPLEAWRLRTLAGLEADLAASPHRPLRTLLGVLRVRLASYVQSPGTDAEAVRMLLELRDLTGLHLPSILSDRIASVVHHLKLCAAGVDGEQQDAILAVRGLRIQPEAFADDGPRMAWRVLERLSSGAWLTPEDEILLQKAKDWLGDSPPDFLPDLESLRNRLLDSLKAATPPTRTPLVSGEVVGVLSELLVTIENLARSAVDEGADLAVEQLIQDLNIDPAGLRDAIGRYTVVLAATCQQAVGDRMVDLLSGDVEFDNVIVDEAARANPLDLLIPISRAARRVILVGDHRQLPHLLEPDVERELEQSVDDETRDQIRKSLFERLFLHVKSLEARDGIKRWATLDTQYRMHPVLGRFVSDAFYEAHEETFGSPEGADKSPHFSHGLEGDYKGKLAVWRNIPLSAGGEERSGHSWRRPSEAKWIAAEARRILQEAPGLSLGVISFYTAQVEAIKEAMRREMLTTITSDGELDIAEAWRITTNAEGEPCERLRVGTVDAFQGKEFDIVMLSVTRSNPIQCADERAKRRRFGHLLLANRLCVAMSRQKRLLVVVGDSAMATTEVPGLREFLKLCKGKHGAIL